MSKAEAKINDYVLEQAHLDWQNVRIQMVIGMLAIFCLCLVNFWSVMQLHVLEDGSLSVARGLLSNGLLIVFQVIAFVLYFVSCLLTALIALEITGRYGNRLGASCAIWSGLLFCVFPWQAYFCLPGKLPNRILSFTFLLAAFLWLRFRKNIDWFPFLTGFVLLWELGVYFYSGRNADYCCNALRGNIFLLFTPLNAPLFFAYVLTGLNCLIRLAFRILSIKSFRVIAMCALAAITLANLSLCGSMYGNFLILKDSALILSWSAFSITMSLICMPVLDLGGVNISRILGCSGLIVLVIFTLTFEDLFTSITDNRKFESKYSRYSSLF